MSELGQFRQIGTLPTLMACPLRSESGQANACLAMSASCQKATFAVQQKLQRGGLAVSSRHYCLVQSEVQFFLSNQIAFLPCWRVRGIFLAPEAERFLRRPVGIAEQHTLALGLKVIIRPRRHHENIVRLERKIQFTDTRASMALDYVEHRAVGTAIGLTGKAVRHPLDENGDGRIDISAVNRIGVPHLHAVCWMQSPMARETVERLTRAIVRIDQKR